MPDDARVRVVSIEPLGVDMPMYDVTTGSGDFIANGLVSHNCFARGVIRGSSSTPDTASTPRSS